MTNDMGRQIQAASMLATMAGDRPAAAAMPAHAAPIVEHALQTCRSLIEVNQTAIDMIWDTVQRQQEFAFTIMQTAFSALPGVRAQDDLWSQATAAYGEACSYGLAAMRAFAATVLDAPRRVGTVAASQAGEVPQR